MLKKAKRKLWTLQHVKRAGLGTEDLLMTFNTIIRPTLEYAAPTFHPMLNQEMRDNIESIQKRASKLIFGWNTSYDEIIQAGKMVTLDRRREELTKKFAIKASKSARFSGWFEEKSYLGLNIREKCRKKYIEKFARTDRLKKSPIYYMTRLLNNEN